MPTSLYRAFAIQAGCYNESNIANSAVFECLVGADTVTLQNASANISTSGAWGTWAFLPVTDRDFVRELPSKQLLDKKISGKRILSGVSSQFNLLPQDLMLMLYRTMPMMVSP